MIRRILLSLIVTAFATNAFAFEKELHRVITLWAWQNAFVDLEQRMGIKPDRGLGSPAQYPKDWIAYGSEREDDIQQSVPPARMINHFLDPEHDAPLTVGYSGACLSSAEILGVPLRMERADVWALDQGTLNEYNLRAARRHQYAALTEQSPEIREEKAALMLRSLGHIVHLVEDMAQPEHTRNDQHLPFLFGSPVGSLYEEWTLENLVTNPRPDQLNFFQGYGAVDLPHFRDYFDQGGAKGLAEFSNRNFVTQDTNYHDVPECYQHSLPSILGATARLEYVDVAIPQSGGPTQTISVVEEVFSSRVHDLYTQTAETDWYHSTYSVFDAELQKYDPAHHVYSLNDQSYYSRTLMLMPRAVGYASGLMRRFFGPGGLLLEWAYDGTNTQTAYAQITNQSTRSIPGSAELTLTYRPGAPYLGYTGFDFDSETIIRGHLDDLGVGEIPAWAQRTIGPIPVPGLHPGDIVQEFPQVAVLREAIGSSDEMITSVVKAAVPSSTLVLKITWPMDVPVTERPMIFVVYCPPSYFCHYYKFSDDWVDNAIPTAKFTKPGSGGGPHTLEIESTTPHSSYTFYVQPKRATPVTIQAYKNGSLQVDTTTTLSPTGDLFGNLIWTVPAEY